MSVFVEMVKGWGNEVGSYEYRVEMVNQRDPRKIITREFVSVFESSVSWGYNRFFKLDWLVKEGYLDTEKDEVLFLQKMNYRLYSSTILRLPMSASL
jgi:hypothetical protein